MPVIETYLIVTALGAFALAFLGMRVNTRPAGRMQETVAEAA
jgi:hypothetical protein